MRLQPSLLLRHRMLIWHRKLEEARKLASSREILLWMTPSEAPKALQASECSAIAGSELLRLYELLDGED